MTLTLITTGIWLGLGAAVPIGPVNVEIARRTLRHGFWAGFALGCGAVTVDVTYAVLSNLGLRPLLGRPMLLSIMGLIGAAILGYLGIMCLLAAAREMKADEDSGPAPGNGHNYLTGLAMTASSPYTLLLWFVTVPGSVGAIIANPAHDLPIVCVGVFCATIAWVVAFTTTLSVLGRFSRRRWLLAANISGGILLLGFAAATIWRIASHSL